MTISIASLEKILSYGTLFKQGLLVTVLLSACTVFFGFFLAFGLALMLLSDIRPLRGLAKVKTDDPDKKARLEWISRFNPVKLVAGAYVQFVRCTPMLVQIFLVYYIVFGFITLPKFTFLGFIQFERFFAGIKLRRLHVRRYPRRYRGRGPGTDRGGQKSRYEQGTDDVSHHHPAGDQEHPSGGGQ